MRKFLFIFLAIAAFQSKAQTTDSLREKLDNIFLNVDKSQIPTGYLKEYGSEFTALHWYNGVLTDSNVVFNLDIFRMTYTDLETAKILSSAPATQVYTIKIIQIIRHAMPNGCMKKCRILII